MTKTIGDALLDLKSRSGLSLNAIATGAGYSGPSSVQAFFHPSYDPPALDINVAQKLATAFEGRGSPPINAEDIFLLSRVSGPRVTTVAAYQSPTPYPSKRDVPIYSTGHARGSVGWFTMGKKTKFLEPLEIRLDKPISYAPRGDGLIYNSSAFGLFNVGSSMSPRLKDGEPFFVESGRPPSAGDDTFIVLDAKESPAFEEGYLSAVLAVFVSRSTEALEVLQLASGLNVTIPLTAVDRVYRVIPWREVCGF